MIKDTTKNLFRFILNNGEVRYSEMLRFIIESKGGKYDPQSSDRGYWSRGFAHHVNVGNFRIHRVNNIPMYSLTEKGMGYLDNPNKEMGSLVIKKNKSQYQNRIQELKDELCLTSDRQRELSITREIQWILERVNELEKDLQLLN
jgi:hypothetical protein